MNVLYVRRIARYQITHFNFIKILLLYLFVMLVEVHASEQLHANSDNYLQLLKTLKPGDRLSLAPGIYKNGLPLHNIVGEEQGSIVITAQDQNNRPVFHARDSANTVSIINSGYVVLSNLELDGKGMDVDAIKAEGHSQWTHHITIDGLYIHGHDNSQQNVGISTKCPAWNWVIRNTTIENVGTGMYFGDSDGTAPFVAAIIENNRILNTIGYNVQIKHQANYSSNLDFPNKSNTIIRGNIFSKEFNASANDDARPNLLVGHWPSSGKGEENYYYIYGNYFYQNPEEALFQGEGRLAFYNNVLINTLGNGIGAVIRPHNGKVQAAHVFYNTIISKSQGISVSSANHYLAGDISNNVIFSDRPIVQGRAFGNVTGAFADADKYLIEPYLMTEKCSVYPLDNSSLSGRRMDPIYYKLFPHSMFDMNGHKRTGEVRGAFSSPCSTSDWRASIKSARKLNYEKLESNR